MRFDYVKYDEKAVITQDAAKKICGNLESLIILLPPGRATSLALTKLEETYMWIGKAVRDDQVARGGSSADVPERSNG